MTAEVPSDDSPADAAIPAALADLAASDDPRDAPPAPDPAAVRLAALERATADRLAAADRSARRWRRATAAAAACAAALAVAATLARRDAADARLAARAESDAVRTRLARQDARLSDLEESTAAADAKLAALDRFDGALLDDHLRHADRLRDAARDRAALRRELASEAGAVRTELLAARREASRRWGLLADTVLAGSPSPDR